MISTESDARSYVADLAGDAAIARLDILIEELARENELQNLVAKATLGTVWQRHVADSAQLLQFCEPSSPWLDLGSGAGFPGLVIAAMRPEISVILIESRKRRVDWLERAVASMELTNCQVEGRRLESVESVSAGVISARAFAPLDRLLALSARFSTKDTCWVLPKGRSAAQEVRALPKNRRNMFHVEQSRTDPEAGIVVGRGQWSAKA
ncbi:16S rRNA (guanine(527)-N(7))-methyltransferase RsmG [Qipengyuania qiaonensis]|uniref:Ribosomal RNA small subunit methyltransferase G n=1 Tax=Qipengyuania qiaonensis TaxID=2867240 RepID=A0ABS7JB52_9SPHN|nr:16S rRNA (guanine(527)-N(7))-methyltransferase RsmG [Qipengyuania qiaonensis]MBX7482247.1 16S rRNA (guanine(527)-N(7))-methyltransferase RsmG [Qipengyuania qiaonensis]